MPARDIRLIVSGFLLALFSSFGQTFFIALFSGEIRAEFELTHGEFGSLYSLATLASGLLMLWIGAALDRVSLRSYAAGATAALAGACVLLATIENPYLLLLALFGLRLAGQGMMSHASLTGMARAFTRHRGKAIAAATLGHPAGEAVLPIIAVTAAAALGWRDLWTIAAAILTVAFVALIKLLEGPSGHGGRGVPSGQSPAGSLTRTEMLRDVRFYLIMPAPPNFHQLRDTTGDAHAEHTRTPNIQLHRQTKGCTGSLSGGAPR